MSTEWYGKNIDIFIMHILIVTQYFWPENFRINDLTAELVNRGHKVTILTGQPNYPEGYIYTDYLKKKSNYSYYKGAKVIIGKNCDIASFVAINAADSLKKCIGLAKNIERKDIILENNLTEFKNKKKVDKTIKKSVPLKSKPKVNKTVCALTERQKNWRDTYWNKAIRNLDDWEGKENKIPQRDKWIKQASARINAYKACSCSKCKQKLDNSTLKQAKNKLDE
jgi:hypothetical protein